MLPEQPRDEPPRYLLTQHPLPQRSTCLGLPALRPALPLGVARHHNPRPQRATRPGAPPSRAHCVMANAGRFKERTAQGVPAAGVANRLVKGELEASVRHREVSTPDSIRRARNQPGPGERRAAPGDVGVDPNLRQGKFGGTRADAVQVDRLLVSQKGTLTERALERQRQGMTGGSLPDDQPAGCGSQKEALGTCPAGRPHTHTPSQAPLPMRAGATLSRACRNRTGALQPPTGCGCQG